MEALGYQPAQEGDASGGGGSVVYEVSQRWPALMRSTAVPFSDIFHNAFTIEELLIDAGTPPASTYDFEVLTGGTVIETVTLSSPPELFTIASSLSAKERLEVLPNSGTASDLANVTFSFLLSI